MDQILRHLNNNNNNNNNMRVLISLVVIVLIWFLGQVLKNSLWLKSKRLRRKLTKQGVKGPTPSFLYGNLPEIQRIQVQAMINKSDDEQCGSQVVAHDYTATLFPYLEQWRKQYGSLYTYSTGARQHLYINEPELVKEMNQNMSLDLGKPSYVTKRLAPMLGNGVVRSNGLLWAQQRKIVAPEFFKDKVKDMVGVMLESAEAMVRKWEECAGWQPDTAAEVRVDEDLRALSADVIARVCFGAAFDSGRQVFSMLRSLRDSLSHGLLFGATSSHGFFGKSKENDVASYEKEIGALIWKSIAERDPRESSERKDLLQLILEAARNDHRLDEDSCRRFIVDNCKSIYFAGHESTAVAASWCLMLLASHPRWQDQIRAEIAQFCPGGIPDANSIPHLKTLTMVLQEVLRLYPPAAFVSREALKETQIGALVVPKGVCIWTLIPTLHRDPEIWGPDANEFKPERFANGVGQACKYPQAYIPFGLGPRLCLGKNFAMAELKVLVSLVVSKFAFSLSPKYRHCPAYRMIVEPGNGVYILINKL